MKNLIIIHKYRWQNRWVGFKWIQPIFTHLPIYGQFTTYMGIQIHLILINFIHPFIHFNPFIFNFVPKFKFKRFFDFLIFEIIKENR